MPSRRLIFTLLVLVFFAVQLGSPQFTLQLDTSDMDYVPENGQARPQDDDITHLMNDQFLVSADPLSGVLDPMLVEQYGYSRTGNLASRTDTKENTQPEIPIDNSTGWKGSEAQIELWDMKRQFAENGTFNDGVDGTTYYPNSLQGYPYGWGLDWDDPLSGGGQNVSTTYDKDEGYIILETKGELDTSSGFVEYRHYDQTYIYWNQTINNVPNSDNLTLTFLFNYDSGIIDIDGDDIDGWLWLDVAIDGVFIDWIDLMTECPSRNTWYQFTIPDITNQPDSFNLEIGISVMTVSGDYYLTNPGGDYDEDGDLDFDLTKINRVFIDNITLVGVEQPSYEAVDLTFHAGSFSTLIVEGMGIGNAIIANPSYWTDSSLVVGISSNVSISCNFDVILLVHNFGNTSWTSQPTFKGVAYTVQPSQSASLSMYTYIGSDSVSIYENFTVLAYLPSDWENETVYDPFLNEVTSQCTFSTGLLEIPTSLLDRLGWWQIKLESPNYAKSVSPQIRIAASWFDNILFRSGNITRASVELGTQDQTPSISDPVNVTWYQPDESVWYQESVSTSVGGVVETTQTTLLGSTTIAGEWTIVAWWVNGTEVAFGTALFDMYHTASLDVPDEYETINIDQGLVISNFVYYEDADTSDFLLDDSVTIEANWSGSVIPFTQDFVKNWWRGEFDTSLIEGGQYTVVITASRPYFDDVSVQFTIICTFETTLDFSNAFDDPIEKGLNEVFTVQMDYDFLNGTGIDSASIDVSHTGPGGGLAWFNFIEGSNGHYSVDIICDLSATYSITITLSKAYHEGASDTFLLIIGETGTSLSILNGSADMVLFGGNYTVVLEYLNSTSVGLTGATLQVEAVTPSTGLTLTSFTPLSDGLYSITFHTTKRWTLLDHTYSR